MKLILSTILLLSNLTFANDNQTISIKNYFSKCLITTNNNLDITNNKYFTLYLDRNMPYNCPKQLMRFIEENDEHYIYNLFKIKQNKSICVYTSPARVSIECAI